MKEQGSKCRMNKDFLWLESSGRTIVKVSSVLAFDLSLNYSRQLVDMYAYVQYIVRSVVAKVIWANNKRFSASLDNFYS